MKILTLHFSFLIILFIWVLGYPQQISFTSMAGPYGGNLGDVAFTSTGEIFVSAYYSASRGIFKSTDNGNYWQHIIPDTSMPWLDYLAMKANNNDDVFAGTNSGGVYKSVNMGATWARVISYPRPECWAIAFNDSNHIFAGDGDNGGVFKSTDNGATWSSTLPNIVAPLAIEINEAGIIYVGTRNNFYRSIDNGNQWVSCYQGLDNQIIASILVDSTSDIFVGTGYYNSGNGVYYSSDFGNTWEQKGLSGKIIYSLTTDSLGNIYASTQREGIYKSQDQGRTWKPINEGLQNYNIFRVQVTTNNFLFACSESEGGIYRSVDYGESWQITGMVAGTVWQGIINESGNIYTATDGGVQKYNSFAGEWVTFGLSNVKSIVIDNDNVLFAGTRWNGVYISTDDGNTWNPTASIGGSGIELFTLALYSDNSIVVGTNDYIKRSTDKGASWSSIINQLPSYLIRNLVIDTEGIIYASSGNNLCKANNFESNFFVIKDNVYIPDRNGVAVGYDGLLFIIDSFYDPGIFKSTDFGSNWSKISDRSASSISIFDDKYIVTGHENGEIMFSVDMGESWLTISLELPANSTIFWTQIDSNGYLYCAASGFGLFKSNSIVTSIGVQEELELNAFSLEQNYPNPFNSQTNIKYTIQHSGRVVLKVFDLMGSEIATVLDRYQQAGIYDLIFQADNLASGIYFYQLQADEFIATKKLILLR